MTVFMPVMLSNAHLRESRIKMESKSIIADRNSKRETRIVLTTELFRT